MCHVVPPLGLCHRRPIFVGGSYWIVHTTTEAAWLATCNPTPESTGRLVINTV